MRLPCAAFGPPGRTYTLRMGRIHAVRDSLPQAGCRLRPAAVGSAALAPATAADNEAPETGRIALHGHG